MSDRPSKTTSPSNSLKPTSSSATPPASQVPASSATLEDFTETPQAPAAQIISTPVIIVTGSPSAHTPTPKPSRPRINRHLSGTRSSPQTPRHETPDERPRSQSQPYETTSTTTVSTMSSASSSPGNTSTAGSTSGSNPGYQLPYAPFPYPMPANTRGSGQQGGQGK